MNVNKAILFLVISVITFHTGSSLSCYYCLGSLHSDCAEGREESMIRMNCGSTAVGASCIQFENIVDNQIAFGRLCSTDSVPCSSYIDCSSCNTDLCNGPANFLTASNKTEDV